MIKVEKVEVETRNAGRPSSPHVDAPYNPQYDQSSTGDTQTEKWTQYDASLSYSP